MCLAGNGLLVLYLLAVDPLISKSTNPHPVLIYLRNNLKAKISSKSKKLISTKLTVSPSKPLILTRKFLSKSSKNKNCKIKLNWLVRSQLTMTGQKITTGTSSQRWRSDYRKRKNSKYKRSYRPTKPTQRLSWFRSATRTSLQKSRSRSSGTPTTSSTQAAAARTRATRKYRGRMRRPICQASIKATFRTSTT